MELIEAVKVLLLETEKVLNRSAPPVDRALWLS
jgi:hypothetical protein